MTDAHCHPWNLREYIDDPENERRETKTAIAASSWNIEQFEYHEALSKKAAEDGAPPVFCCFALHPELTGDEDFSAFKNEGLELLISLAEQDRLDAVGEAGFDLYNEEYKAGEKVQDEIFSCHLETAIKYELPMVIHARRAMHKIFPLTAELKKVPAIVFHSWPGTRAEGEALLKRGINAYFSFGTTILKNHRRAIASAAHFPSERILLETDAPYQSLRGKSFSSWRDLKEICSCLAHLRKDAGSTGSSKEELEVRVEKNFFQVFESHLKMKLL
ncbi:MAG: TatD family hydrolase [Treponema sp.]|nr:TatD family hydrolase [Treponema sp.]